MVSRSRRSRPAGPLRLLALISTVATGVVLRSAAAEQQQQQVFRCESEEDLDGSACRVDMLPDSALAEMVYERWVRRVREVEAWMFNRILPVFVCVCAVVCGDGVADERCRHKTISRAVWQSRSGPAP